MEGWKTYKLGEVAKLVKKNISPKNFNSEIYIGLEHIGQGNFLLESTGTANDVTSNKAVFKDGDILYGKIRPYFKKVYRPKFSGICSTDIFVINSTDENLVTQDFLYQLIKTQEFTDKATETSSGTKMPRADWNSLTKLFYRIPPFQEQKAIASILSALDDKIELNLQMIKTLEEMAMALYKHWFVDFGPFQDSKFVESELGMIPEGWEVKSIYNIANYVNGAAFKPSEFTEEGLYVIKISELNSGINSNTGKSVKHVKPEQIIDSGCVLFSWSATLDIFLWEKGQAYLNQHIFNVLPNGTISLEVLYFLLKNIIKYFKAIAAERATTMGHIKLTHLKETFISIPIEKDIQLQIDKVFKPIYSQILANLIENQTLTTLRDTLLPKLISGEVRVKDIEQMVAASL